MGLPQRFFPRDIDCLGEVFDFVGERLARCRADERTTYCVNLVVEELFTNFVKYNQGADREIAINIHEADGAILIDLVDVGVDPFDPASAADPGVSAGLDHRRPGGLGLHLVRSMVDSLRYDYELETRTMRVSVSKRLEPRDV